MAVPWCRRPSSRSIKSYQGTCRGVQTLFLLLIAILHTQAQPLIILSFRPPSLLLGSFQYYSLQLADLSSFSLAWRYNVGQFVVPASTRSGAMCIRISKAVSSFPGTRVHSRTQICTLHFYTSSCPTLSCNFSYHCYSAVDQRFTSIS